MDEILQSFRETHASEIKQVKRNQKGIIDFFMGEIMKASRGKANPKKARKMLIEALNE